MGERVLFRTTDGVRIVGDYYSGGDSGCILLHMMPADRISWAAFAEKLSIASFSALAIDLRGHGESQGGPSGYQSFSSKEHQTSRLDVEAAAEFLRSKKVTPLFLVGASIGANLALQYLAEHARSRAAILFSAGLDYRGIKTEPLVALLNPAQKVYFIASRDDEVGGGVTAARAAEILHEKCIARKDLKIFDVGGHGTNILERNTKFTDEIIAWLNIP